MISSSARKIIIIKSIVVGRVSIRKSNGCREVFKSIISKQTIMRIINSYPSSSLESIVGDYRTIAI